MATCSKRIRSLLLLLSFMLSLPLSSGLAQSSLNLNSQLPMQPVDTPYAIEAPVTVPPWRLNTPQGGSPTFGSSLLQNTEPGVEDSTTSPTSMPEPTEDPYALPDTLARKNPDTFTLLLIGTDAYRVEDAGRSDAMIIAQINPKTAEIKLVSFLRDLYVKIPGHGKNRLNAAYVFGGADLLKRTLETNFGVQVDRTLAVNFSLMAELVDQIGGISVDVSEKERVQLNSILKFYNKQNGHSSNDGLLESAGVQHLSGKQALSYSRIRKIDSDFQRTNRQQIVLEAIFARLTELDSFTLMGLVLDNMPKVQTDITAMDALSLVPICFNMGNIQFESMHIPLTNAYYDDVANGMMVLVPNLSKNNAALSDFLNLE